MTIHLPAKATFISITPRQRQQIEHLIESLITMLDMIDGNADDEPSLGWRAPGRTGKEDQASEDFMTYICGHEDGEEDAGDQPEWDEAEAGLADHDALCDESLHFLSFAFDKSGKDIADKLLQERLRSFRPSRFMVCSST